LTGNFNNQANADGLTERGEKCHEYHGSRATHARNAKSQS
jgi:hypothetical protein